MGVQVLLAVAYVLLARHVWSGVRRRAAAAVAVEALPVEDRPPRTAVGWPPSGARYRLYVERGFAALDDYLSDG
ncbi:MAG TPA: hypothetical protein VLW53_17525, partial [Candidatus Eisenbacteria bacterium]|nr:hypothetical protein [Candidatus Eisenbacteria bacterium]